MAYTPDTLVLYAEAGGRVGRKEWLYDTVDVIATVYAIGYISDAATKGMEKGDRVSIRVWTTAIPATNAAKNTAAAVAAVLAATYEANVMGISTAGAADLSDGTAISVANT